MAKFYRKWFKVGAGAAISVVSIVTLFAFLISYYGFEITGTDDICKGTLDDPCMSFVNVTNPTKYNVDMYNQDEVELVFSPAVPDYKIFRKDGRCSGKEGSSCCSPDGICLKGWKFTDFTPATRPLEDKVYVQRFPAYSTTQFLVWGLKENPTDRVKWDFSIDAAGLNNGYLDPVWEYGNDGTGNLMGHWKFNGNAIDSSQYGNDGTVTGASIVSGIHSLAYDFDGVNDNIIVGGTPLQNASGTISAWIKPGTQSDTGFVVYGIGSGTNRYYLRLSAANSIQFIRGDLTPAVTYTLPSIDTCYHIVGTWNSTGTINIYVDGVLRDTNTWTGGGGDTGFNIGMASSVNYFNGTIDEIRVYNITLTASEIRELYNETKVSHSNRVYGAQEEAQIDSDNLFLHYKLDGDVTDATGISGTGSIIGNGAFVPSKFGLGVKQTSTVSSGINTTYIDTDLPTTLSMWYYTDEDGTFNRLFQTNSRFESYISNGKEITFRTNNGTHVDNQGTTNDCNKIGNWVHIVFALNSTHKQIYCNGVIDLDSDSYGAIANTVGNVYIGSRSDGSAVINATFDDIRIYNGTMLSASQVRQLYNETKTSHATRLYGAQEEANVAEDNLVGHWKFNGDFTDSKNGYDGSNVGASFTTGRFGLSAEFESTDRSVVAHNSNLNVYQNLTISYWFKHKGFSSKKYRGLMVKRTSNSQTPYNVLFYNDDLTSMRPCFNHYSNIDGWALSCSDSVSYFPPNEWHHVVIVRDDNIGDVIYYYDGVDKNAPATTYTAGSIYSLNTQNLLIGNDQALNIGPEGQIDDLRLYNVSFTPAQVRQLYNETLTSHPKRIYGSPEMI